MEEYNFVKNPPDDYFCVVCAKLLSEPHLTDCCGQHFGQVYLEQWFKKTRKLRRFVLMHCRSESFNHMRSLPMKRKIDDLDVYCPNYNQQKAARWSQIGELNPTRMNMISLYTVVCTQGCGLLINRKHLVKQCNKFCQKRMTTCTHYGKKDHIADCEEYPVNFPRGCDESSGLKRMDLSIDTLVCVV